MKENYYFHRIKISSKPFQSSCLPFGRRILQSLTGQAIYPSTYICQKFQITTLFLQNFLKYFYVCRSAQTREQLFGEVDKEGFCLKK